MQITRNFNLSEFQCKSGAEMPQEVLNNIIELAGNLQTIREHLDRPIVITSGYRSPEHNESIGGATNSQHIYGKAVDIKVEGLSSQEVYDAIENIIHCGDIKEGGLGLYSTWVHYDIRGTKARWNK